MRQYLVVLSACAVVAGPWWIDVSIGIRDLLWGVELGSEKTTRRVFGALVGCWWTGCVR